MKKHIKKPGQTAEPFVMLPRSLLRSDAWRSMRINDRRLLDVLMLDHMRHAGKENGHLKAPYEQLEAFGMQARTIHSTIRRVEELGLVKCQRRGRRVASEYELTWLELHDGTPPSNAWRQYVNPNLRPLSQPRKVAQQLAA